MAGVKISPAPPIGLPTGAALTGAELIPMDQTVAGLTTTIKASAASIAALGVTSGTILGTANEIAVSVAAGVATISFSPNLVIPAPPTADSTTLTVNAASAAITSANSRSMIITAANGDARLAISTNTATGTAGNAQINLDTFGVQNWVMGNVRSDGSWRVSASQTLGTGDRLKIAAGGTSTFFGPTGGTVLISDSGATPTLSNFVVAASAYTVGQWGIGMDNGDTFTISRLDVAHTALQIALAGNVTIPAATSGNTLTVGVVAGANAIVLSGPGTAGGGILQNSTLTASLIMNSAGTDFGQIGSNATQTWYLGHGPSPVSIGTVVLAWNGAGNVNISNPTATTTALSVGGIANGFSGVFSAPAGTGTSFGMLVSGGTNASDTCAQFNNAANTIDFMRIFGTGQINWSDGTVISSMQYGGVLQFGSISNHVLSFFTNNTNWWDIATDGGLIRHGITGGSQGAGTINANGVFLSANQIFFGVPASASTTIARTDVGKTVVATGTITVPNAVFSQGDAVSIYNNSGAAISISAGITTMRLAGTATTGSRTLAQRGMATLWFNSGTEVVVMGAGVT